MPAKRKSKPVVENKFKIHAHSTQHHANPGRRGTCNGVFYKTYADALERAKEYAGKSGGEAMVIYEAIAVVRPARAPIEVIKI